MSDEKKSAAFGQVRNPQVNPYLIHTLYFILYPAVYSVSKYEESYEGFIQRYTMLQRVKTVEKFNRIHIVDGQLAIIRSKYRRKNKYTGLTICLQAGYEANITNFNWLPSPLVYTYL